MAVEKKTWEELLKPDPGVPHSTVPLLHGSDDEEYCNAILSIFDKFPDAAGIVVFADLRVTPDAYGKQSVLPYGPGCETVPDLQPVLDEPMRHHLYDLPSQRQYPVYYVERADMPAANQG